MKVISGISALTLFVSVGSLESKGAWWILALVLGASSLALLFFTCDRLGYLAGPRHRRRVTLPQVR